MNLDELKKAGFTDQEIGQYVADKTPKLLAAGFSDEEVRNHFRVPRTGPDFGMPGNIPEEPYPFDIDRIITEGNYIATPENMIHGEDVARSLLPAKKRIAALGYSTEAATNRALAGFFTHLDLISDFLSEKTGLPKGTLLSDDFLKKLSQNYQASADRWKKRAEEVGAGFFDELIGETAGGVIPGAVQFAIDLGSGLTFPAMSGAQQAKVMDRNEFLGALTEAGKTGALAGILRALHPLKLYLKAPAVGAAFAIQAAGEGAEPREIAKSFGVGVGLAAFPTGSRGAAMGLNEVRRDLSTAMVRKLAEQPRIEPTIEEGARTPPEEQKQAGGPAVEPGGAKNHVVQAAARPGRETGIPGEEIIPAVREPQFNKKEIMADPDWSAARQKGDKEAATRIVQKGWAEWETEGVRLTLEDPAKAIYLTVPRMVPANNAIPRAFAEKLAADLGGEVISGADYIKPTEKKETKTTGRGGVVSYPKGYETVDLEGLKQTVEGREVVVVDDTGRAVRPFLRALVAGGIKTKTIAYLMKSEPSMAVIADKSSIDALKSSLEQAKVNLSPEEIARGMTRREVLEIVAAANKAKSEEQRTSLAQHLQEMIWDKTGVPEEFIHDKIMGMTPKKGAGQIPTKETPMPEGGNPFKESVVQNPVYHGSLQGKIKTFGEKGRFPELGPAFFTDDPSIAKQYSLAGQPTTNLKENYHPLGGKLKPGEVTEVYLDIRKPITESTSLKEILDGDIDWLEPYLPERIQKEVQWAKEGKEDLNFVWDDIESGNIRLEIPGDEIRPTDAQFEGNNTLLFVTHQLYLYPKSFIKKKYDGIIAKDAEVGGTTYIPFKKEQIKPLPKPSPPPSEDGGTILFSPKKGFRREPQVDISPGEITGRADILRFLQEKLGIPIRSGRFQDKALGIFKVEPEVIRTRNFADIEVISHELGHALQKFLWPQSMKTGAENLPFIPYQAELGELSRGVEVRVGQGRLSEGFAEFLRLYVTDSAAAETRTPHFYKFFDQYLNQKTPESREVFLQARSDYDRYMTQPAYQRVRSQISIKEKPDPGKTWRDRLDDLYTMTMDEFHPLLVAEDRMTGGERMPVGESPYGLARLFNGWIGKANSWLKFSPFEFKTYKNTGKSLEAILKPVANQLDEFSTYMVARRVPGLAEREIDVGIRPEDAKEVIAQKEKEHPEFSRTFDELQQYQDHLLTYLRDSGILAGEIYTKIREVSKDYDPFYRVFEGEGQGGGGALGRGFEAWQPVKEIRGGWQRIQDPVESIIKNTMLYINLAERNAVGQSLVKLAETREGLGRFVEEIPERRRIEQIKAEELFTPQGIAKMKEAGVEMPEFYQVFRPAAFTPRENVIAVWTDGVQREYQVTPDIWRVIKAMDREGMNALEKLAAFPARWLRAGSVLTPEFISRNPARDMFSAFINTKFGFIPGYDLARGIFHFIKKDEHYWNWEKSGGATSTLASMDRDYFQDKMGEILQKSPIMNAIKNPIELLRVLGEITEAGTRLGEFLHGEKKLGTDKEALQAAGFSSRELTVDFQRVGAKTRAVNSLIAFFNANNQGVDRTIRQFKDNPGGTSLRVMASITLPSLLLAWANNDDPRYWEVPQWQRDLSWIIIPNHMSKEKWESLTPGQKHAEVAWFSGSIYRFPKPWIEGVLFGSVPERILQGVLNKDPDSFKDIGNSIWRAVSPGVVPSILVPWLENKTNYSLFFDRRIVPENRKDLPPEFQYGPYTTDAAKKLGELLGKLPWTGIEESLEDVASPAKIENLVRGWTGGLGYYALQLASAGMRAAGLVEPGPQKPASTLADIPLIKAFVVRYPQGSTESISQFYENYRKSEGDWKAIDALIKREGRIDRAIEVMQQASAVRLGSFKQALDQMHGLVEMVYQNPTMTPEEKAELVDITYFQMIEIAKGGNQIFKQVNKAMKTATEGPGRARIPEKTQPQPKERKPLRSMPFVGGPEGG